MKNAKRKKKSKHKTLDAKGMPNGEVQWPGGDIQSPLSSLSRMSLALENLPALPPLPSPQPALLSHSSSKKPRRTARKVMKKPVARMVDDDDDDDNNIHKVGEHGGDPDARCSAEDPGDEGEDEDEECPGEEDEEEEEKIQQRPAMKRPASAIGCGGPHACPTH